MNHRDTEGTERGGATSPAGAAPLWKGDGAEEEANGWPDFEALARRLDPGKTLRLGHRAFWHPVNGVYIGPLGPNDFRAQVGGLVRGMPRLAKTRFINRVMIAVCPKEVSFEEFMLIDMTDQEYCAALWWALAPLDAVGAGEDGA